MAAFNLNPNITMENGARLLLGERPRFNDAETEMSVVVELRTPNATNYLICRRVLTIRNGPAVSDKLVKNTPLVGGDHFDRLAVQSGVLTLASNIVTTLAAAFDGGNSPTNKRDALVAALVSAGVIDSVTLPGS